MSVLSSGDQTKYANSKTATVNPILNFEPLDELATADVDVTPTYPMTSIAVTNTSADWGDVVENLLFRIEQSDGTIIAWGVTRKDAIADTFYPDTKSDGDFGYATNEGLSVVSGDVVRVYKNKHMWAMISRVASGGIQYKRWDLAYTNEGSSPVPVVIMGADQQQFVDTGTSLATFALDASDSYDWLTGTLGAVAFSWTLPSVAVVTGGAINNAAVTFTLPAGIYRVSCAVTGLNGSIGIGTRTLYVNDTASNKPVSEDYAISAIGVDSTDVAGWEGQFTLSGDLTSLVYPGMRCHLFAPVYYDGSRLTDNDAFNDVFIGYLVELSLLTDSRGVQSTTLTFRSPLKLCRLLPSATQFMEEVASPSAWTEVKKGLSDPAFAAFYALVYHTTVIDNHDFIYESSIRDLRRRVFGFPADTINAHLDVVGLIMSGDVGCRDDGTITLTQKPNLKNDTDRDALDSKFTWTEDSLRDRLSIAPRLRPNIAYLIMAAVSYDGNPNKPSEKFAAKAPGRAQAQGVTKTNLPDISTTVTGGAAELYRIIGHWFAYLNNPLDKLDVPIHAMLDICTPADADWHILNVSETDYLPISTNTFGIRWSATMRMRPARITRTWGQTNGVWTKSITAQCRVESKGRPGVFHPTFKGQLAPYINPLTGWLEGLGLTMPDINIDFSIDLPDIGGWDKGMAFNDFGLSGFTDDFNGAHPSWVSLSAGLTGDVVAQCFDGDTPGAGLMVLWDDSQDELKIYDNPDISDDPTDWLAVATIDISGTGFTGQAHIISNSDVTMLAIQTATRTLVYRRPTGSSWDSGVVAGDTASADTDQVNKQFGAAIDGTNQWVSGRESVNDGYKIYKAVAANGTFVPVANQPSAALAPFPMLNHNAGDLYASSGIALTGGAGAVIQGNSDLIASSNDLVSHGGDQNLIGVPGIPDRSPPSSSVAWDGSVDWWVYSSNNNQADGTPVQYGYSGLIYGDDSLDEISYTVSTIDWETITVQFYDKTVDSEENIDYSIKIRFLDENFNELYADTKSLNNITDGTLTTNDPWVGEINILRAIRRRTVTSTPGSPISGVRYFEQSAWSDNLESFDGSVVGLSGVYTRVFVSRVLLGTGASVTVDSKTQINANLYSIDDASEIWTTITPTDSDSQNATPQRWNAFDILSGQIWMIAKNNNGEKRLFNSTDSGASWNEIDGTRYDWLRMLGASTLGVLGGDYLLAITNDNFGTFHDRAGQWGSIGSVGFMQDFSSEGL
jgi:hypothetical protein